MKNLFIFCLVIFSVSLFNNCTPSKGTSATSQNSLDWKGSYSGILPCADCEGIMTKLSLREDNTYSLQTQYIGKSNAPEVSNGTFKWNKDGSQVILGNIKEGTAPRYYNVGENKLTQLDLDGRAVKGDLSTRYVLVKDKEGELNKYWKLIEVNGISIMQNATAKKEPHMILHAQDNKVTGSRGCNNFTGSFQINAGNRISFSPLAATKMFCTGTQDTEDLMFKALQNADSYHLSGDTLQLFRARMSPLAKFAAVYLK